MHDLAAPAPSEPLLLVSVRDELEAASAIAGGCQILDVKDPCRGALGFAGIEAIAAVAAAGIDAGLPVSAALGEVADWDGVDTPRLPGTLRFAKLGLARMAQRSSWRDVWLRLRERINPKKRIGWIAVAYGDWQAAGAPDPGDVIDAAIETKCAGVLFDTWDKRQLPLTELVEASHLAEWLHAIRRAGLLSGLAGRLDAAALSRLALKPDIAAVRSAACEGGDRMGSVSVEAVRRLRKTLSGDAKGA